MKKFHYQSENFSDSPLTNSCGINSKEIKLYIMVYMICNTDLMNFYISPFWIFKNTKNEILHTIRRSYLNCIAE